MILSSVELTSYAPGLCSDDVAIQRAQSLAEGPLGANRPLAKTSTTETPRTSREGIIRLARGPIDPDTPIQVFIRDTGHLSTSLDYQQLTDTQFSVDYDLMEITIPQLAGTSVSSFSTGGVSYGHRNTRQYRRSRRPPLPSVKVIYTAGFDFQATPVPAEVEALKMALVNIIQFQQSDIGKGVGRYDVDEHIAESFSPGVIQMAGSAMGRTAIQDMLEIFKQYRPCEFAT